MNRRIYLPRRHGIFVDDLVDHRCDVLSRKRLFAGHHFIKHDAQRKNVAAPTDGTALHLFLRIILLRLSAIYCVGESASKRRARRFGISSEVLDEKGPYLPHSAE